ncbi:MAG: hypothetical protein ACJA1A_001667 [Saprospiraceae bacterium]|jgi:hypothetical protein|tara:strand:+ start:837 stop:1190 length:354 start_codon:yes stop_codon:yes gene_type:complete
MKSNIKLKRDVQKAINWEPSMEAAEIDVTAKEGVVTLSGTVDSYSNMHNAANASKKVRGVKAVAQEITVNYGNSLKKNATAIATNVLDAWKNNWYRRRMIQGSGNRWLGKIRGHKTF